MNVNLLSIVLAAVAGTFGALLLRIKWLSQKSNKLQREKDINEIKTSAYEDINKAHLDTLVRKLNDKVRSTRRPTPPKGE